MCPHYRFFAVIAVQKLTDFADLGPVLGTLRLFDRFLSDIRHSTFGVS